MDRLPQLRVTPDEREVARGLSSCALGHRERVQAVLFAYESGLTRPAYH